MVHADLPVAFCEATGPGILRHEARRRANHWITAITFVLLAASGLAFFHPAFIPLTNRFGSPRWRASRTVDRPRDVREPDPRDHDVATRPVEQDPQGIRRIGDVVMNHDERMPPMVRLGQPAWARPHHPAGTSE